MNENKQDTKESLERGLKESAEGNTVNLGDFTQYANDKLEIENPYQLAKRLGWV